MSSVGAAPDVSAVVRSGACVATALPVSAESVSHARRRVRTVARGLGLTPERVDDLVVITAELTTNALAHGGGRMVYHIDRPVAGLPELWLYVRGSRRPELVVTVFDTGDFWMQPVSVPPNGLDVAGVDGRGLQIIAALAEEAGGRRGLHPSRSRLGEQRLKGTAVWVAFPVPELVRAPAPVEVSPAEAIRRLAELLRARGVGDLIARACEHEAVLSLSGLTVWFGRGTYSWQGPAGRVRVAVADVVDVAEQILAETELARRRSEMEG